ncbi:MAG: hypothetical protein NVS2B17_28320 [Candidatus Velthaea sp.]
MLGAIAAAIALGACARSDSPLDLAERTTKAVYNLDLDATQANFDDELKKTVTRAQVGELSDKMHALGVYKGLKATSSDPDKGRYDFEVDFDHGIMVVEMRLDPSGKIGAYRIAPARVR